MRWHRGKIDGPCDQKTRTSCNDWIERPDNMALGESGKVSKALEARRELNRLAPVRSIRVDCETSF